MDHANLTDLAAHGVLASGAEGEQYINGNVTFENVTLQRNLSVHGLINGHNLSEVATNTLMKSGDQVVTGSHRIIHLEVSGEVCVNETVNGLDFSKEIVDLVDAGTISGNKTFAESVGMKNVETSTVNGINLTKFADRVAYIDENTRISGFTTLDDDFIAEKNLKVQLINTLNLTNLVETAIMKTGTQRIWVDVHLEDAVFQDVLNTNLFNSINFTTFADNIVYKCIGPNKEIKGKFSFDNITIQGLLKVMNLQVKGEINKINLTLLNQQTVKETGNFTLTGLKRVEGILYVRDLTAILINGFKFPEDFVSLSGDEVIIGKKEFVEDVFINGDITHRETINGVDLSNIAQRIVQIVGNETVSSNVLFLNDVTVKGNMRTKLINGVNISAGELLLSYGNQTVTAPKVYSDVHVHGQVVSGNHINGFNLQKIQKESFISGIRNVLEGQIKIMGNVYVNGEFSFIAYDNDVF